MADLKRNETLHKASQPAARKGADPPLAIEEAKSWSDRRLDFALRAARAITWDIDLATDWVACSANAVEIIGMAGAPLADFIARVHPDDRAAVEAEHAELLRSGASGHIEFRFIRPDGAVIWLEKKAQTLFAEEQPVRMVGLCCDLAERKEREKQIAFQASLLDSVGQAVIATDPAGKVVYWNKAAEALYGWSAAEAAGRQITALTPAIEAQEAAAAIMQSLNAGRSWCGEFKVRRRDGSVFQAQVTDTPVYDPSGALIGVVGVSEDISARKVTEQTMRESAERLRMALAAGRMFAWELHPDSGEVLLTGGDEAIGYNRITLEMFLDQVDPEHRQRLRTAARAALADGTPLQEEFRYSVPSGRSIWLRVEGRHSSCPSGRTHLIGVSSDVTRRKEAELEAEARAKQQEAVALFSRLALQTPPLDQLFQSATELITRTLGIKVAMILEKLGSESELAIVAGTGCIPADLGTRRVPSDATSLSGRAFESPKPVILDDFAAAPLASASLAREYGVTSGMAVGIGDRSRRFGVLTVLSSTPRHFNEDRTNFIQAIAFVLGAAVEQKAAEARLLLRDRALESIEQGILITDGRMPDQSIVYANPAFARITGYALDDLVGRNPHLLDGQYTDPNLIAQIRTAIREGGGFSGTLQKNRKDGSTFWTELTIAPVRDESGRITNFVGVHSDVTKKIALEADLRQAQKMEAVGQLTGGVAHDFNNLLTVILGNAEILADEVQQANLAPMATMIVDAAERGADLTRRLLAFGRRQTLRPELLSLDTIVDSMVGMLRRTIGEQIRLRTTLASGTQAAFIDRSLLETAILNLVVNARDAIEAAGTLTIGTREICIESDLATPDLPAGTYLVLTVADTGTGMSAEVRERAFEPFFTTKETGKGTGLGLPMVYGFAKQSGGHVRITSELGRGTNIELFLPAAQGEQRPASLAAAPGLAARAAGRECILVVEDQEEVRRFVVGQLGGLGYDVTSAGSSADALQLLRSRPDVALLFTDVVLADGSDGLQLADDARRLCPDLKVLFTSGYPEEVLKRRRFGEEPFLRKPYRRRELAEAVRGALDRR